MRNTPPPVTTRHPPSSLARCGRQMRAYSFANTGATLEPESRAHLCFLLGLPELFSNRVFLVLAVTMVREGRAGPHARIRQGGPGVLWEPGSAGQARSRLLRGNEGKTGGEGPQGRTWKGQTLRRLSEPRVRPTAILVDSITSEKYYQPKRRAEIALLSLESHRGRAVNWQRFHTRPPGLWNGPG